MGNFISSNSNSKISIPADKKFGNFYEIIDYIATYYILTMDFKSMENLAQKDYCDKLVVLTSDIINKHFSDLEVTYLEQRMKKGVEENITTKDKIIFLNKDQLEDLDIQNDKQKSIRKKRVCIGIAKFYVKIAHIFAAIVMTINPIYTYKDNEGNTVKIGLLEKDKIPKNVAKKLYKMNICDSRIRALNRGEIYENVPDMSANVHPKVCDMNINKDGTVKNLSDEPGIKELMQLYLDDNYDYSTGVFLGMSDETAKEFQKDLKLFYTTFTGNENMPPEIKKFSDIKLRDYRSNPGCSGSDPFFKFNYNMKKQDKLFVEYANNIKFMIERASDKQSELLFVINELFSFVMDPYTQKKKIRINPKLTDESLQVAIQKTRKIIVDLYVGCEQDYLKGIKIYEAIVESKIIETTQKQIQNLEKKASELIYETKQEPENISNQNQDQKNQFVKEEEDMIVQQPSKPPIIEMNV